MALDFPDATVAKTDQKKRSKEGQRSSCKQNKNIWDSGSKRNNGIKEK